MGGGAPVDERGGLKDGRDPGAGARRDVGVAEIADQALDGVAGEGLEIEDADGAAVQLGRNQLPPLRDPEA